MAVPDEVKRLVELFDDNVEHYRSQNYNETRLRVEFLDPLFKALGWDMNNERGYAEAYKDVIHEDAINIGGATKAPDYCFRIGSERKFFLEAKKPAVNIKDDVAPAYQLRRYAWSAKLPLSVLSDFDEFATYDCRVKPVEGDKASKARILFIPYTEYEIRWEEINSIFSREAVLKGSFDKYAETTKAKKGTAEVDDAFLSDIESWRDILARNLALRNPGLSQRELNYAVQVTIDRIIFLRICEDRSVEGYGQLLALTNGAGIYARLLELFQRADDRYNSGLFHFHKEKGRDEAPDSLTPHLIIDDKALREIVSSLYYPNSPYEFSVVPATILGQVYEQFLGKVIRLTAGHQAKVEDKPEVKKAGGVYYTPDYIVDYIVENTVGTLLGGKTPNQAAKLKILDPACGSGSFLIGAYQKLLDWHRDWYIGNNPAKHRKEIYQARGGEWKLTVGERKRILLDNIYGVDIDTQAVEVTKLSLLLKVLEDPGQLELQVERVLPDLSDNIKCGNSLIESDYYDNGQLDFADGEELLRINAFDWEKEFPKNFSGNNPGFDAVIGNPPYVRQETLGEMKDYFKGKYSTYHGAADLYVYFIEKGVSLLGNKGIFCYIVSNKWMRANYGGPLRSWVKEQNIEEITDFGDLPVFQKITTYPCILRIRKDKPDKDFNVTQIKSLDFLDLGEYVEQSHYLVSRSSLSASGWSLVDEKVSVLLGRIRSQGIPLNKYIDHKIYFGIKTGLNKAFVIDDKTKANLVGNSENCSPHIRDFPAGKDVKRYQQPTLGRHLIFIPKGFTELATKNTNEGWRWLQSRCPEVAHHLEEYAAEAEKRCDKGNFWWELRACDYYDKFEKPKIVYPSVSSQGDFTLDSKGLLFDKTCYFIPCDDLYLLGLLNSKLLRFFFRSIGAQRRGGYYEYLSEYVSQLPIRRIDENSPVDIQAKDRIDSLVGKILELNVRLSKARISHELSSIRRQIDTIDQQLDQLVYELYGLTDEEIQIVEGA